MQKADPVPDIKMAWHLTRHRPRDNGCRCAEGVDANAAGNFLRATFGVRACNLASERLSLTHETQTYKGQPAGLEGMAPPDAVHVCHLQGLALSMFS